MGRRRQRGFIAKSRATSTQRAPNSPEDHSRSAAAQDHLNQCPTGTAVAVLEGVDSFELGVRESRLGERRE